MTTTTNNFNLQKRNLAGGLLITLFMKCKERTVKKSLYRRTCQALQSLDDRTLYDIGITRSMIKEIARARVAQNKS
jgi:uncharacterized protein YjiS (DUF1127 family)